MSYHVPNERETQRRVIRLFTEQLGYDYLGNWIDQPRDYPVEEDLLRAQLGRRGYHPELINRAVNKFVAAVVNMNSGLYEANKRVYSLLRYGIDVRKEAGEQKEIVYLIDWEQPAANHYGIAEEVAVRGMNGKRPDLVMYVNGIALGILELKSGKVSVAEGIRQNLDNQQEYFIPQFFTTAQLVMAGNDSEGLRYGTILTPQKFYLAWKEDSPQPFAHRLDQDLYLLFGPERLLAFVHDFIIFDQGIKKVARPSQYFGILAARERLRQQQGGILWHTQGSGKSLLMVLLARWIREHIKDSRILIITDRDELDKQIEGTFSGNEEPITRTRSVKDLIAKLAAKDYPILCSLIHKFGLYQDASQKDYDKYVAELKKYLPAGFRAQGRFYVFVDECHRTQSGKLHEAMKAILPDALFVGFTGTPLLKKDKKTSLEVFGSYIGDPYKFNEAVEDKVVLDLLYEARDVDQYIYDQESIDEWFDAQTRGLSDLALIDLKKKWGTMQKVLSSRSRLDKIVRDICMDFTKRPRLVTGTGNAMLVSGSIYQACKFYEIFQQGTILKDHCAIITSYRPQIKDIKGESTGEGNPTEKLHQYEVYTKMLNGKSPEAFEEEVKKQFIHEPGRMKLLIVVDKLLTGFDAPSATYLYIDKKMQDHGLFQAVCRVNRVDTEDKEYGYIVDYKDLFDSLKHSITTYTGGAFDDYDNKDVKGLLTDRFERNRQRLEEALDAVVALCEGIHPATEDQYIRYFCGDTKNRDDLKAREGRRLLFYKLTASLLRAWAQLASEMGRAGYSAEETAHIKKQVNFYVAMRDNVKLASGDKVDLKHLEPGMRQLIDMYLEARPSRKISHFENESLLQLIERIVASEDESPGYGGSGSQSRETIAEMVENNVRRAIIEEQSANPKYYDRMSQLLEELITQRREGALAYEAYLKRLKELAEAIDQPGTARTYPDSIKTKGQRALYDNLGEDEALAHDVHRAVIAHAMDDFREHPIRKQSLRIAILPLLNNDEELTDKIMQIVIENREY